MLGNIYDEQVLLCGDYSFKEIKWEDDLTSWGAHSEQVKFCNIYQDALLYQHVREFTKVQGSHPDQSLLASDHYVIDLILSLRNYATSCDNSFKGTMCKLVSCLTMFSGKSRYPRNQLRKLVKLSLRTMTQSSSSVFT